MNQNFNQQQNYGFDGYDFNYNYDVSYNVEPESNKKTKSPFNLNIIIIVGAVLILGILVLTISSCTRKELTDVVIEEIPVLYVGEEYNVNISAVGRGNLKDTVFNSSIKDLSVVKVEPVSIQTGSFEQKIVPKKVGETELVIKAFHESAENIITKSINLVVCDVLDANKVTNKNIKLNIGGTHKLNLNIGDSSLCRSTVQATISDTKVATVSNLTLTALKQGTTTMKITDGVTTIEYNIEVFDKNAKILATDIKVSATTVTLTKGSTKTVSATVLPSNASDKTITWLSNNTKVATVDRGTIKAVGVGKAAITATTNDGSFLYKDIEVIVTDSK